MAHHPAPATTAADTTGLLLAAGSGTRLGRGPKALLPFRGRTLVEVLADVLLDGGCREVVVVLGAGAESARKAPGLQRHTVVENPDWQTGMGSSFRLGLAAARPQDHVLVALVDQPGLTPETVGRLLKAHRPGRVTAAAYRPAAYPEGTYPKDAGELRRGHPLLLDATLRGDAAATAAGDAGARLFLQARPELIDLVDCTPPPGSGQSGGEDLDTPDQLYLLGWCGY
jgi:nicotine blue oxidoreductase